LDKWVEDKSKEMEDRAKKNSNKYGSGKSNVNDHDEVIVFDEEMWEDIIEEEREEEYEGEWDE
jgi:hypothetical protein